jgi:hypothetical protein
VRHALYERSFSVGEPVIGKRDVPQGAEDGVELGGRKNLEIHGSSQVHASCQGKLRRRWEPHFRDDAESALDESSLAALGVRHGTPPSENAGSVVAGASLEVCSIGSSTCDTASIPARIEKALSAR